MYPREVQQSSPALFRAHPLDGAMLYFHPETGTHVRVCGPATRDLERSAPRVVMFGITNACNLRCEFCSRDVTRESAWTATSAAEVIEGLARAGTLEVAFGGGEPFAFRDFPELLLRLRRTTRLALHVTTNGTLLDDAMLARTGRALGQVRVSIYDGVPWRPIAQTLLRAGQVWGANVLVTAGSLRALPQLLLQLASLGARDVSLLSYVGPDRAMLLTAAGDEALAAIVRASPLPCRVSVCFGGRLAVPRLWDGMDDEGDCGAGLDFVSITPDRRVQSCSFQEASFPITSAEDVLSSWRSRRAELRRASPRPGCARVAPSAPRPPREGTQVWQSFSGNNSGECVLVSRFESAEGAEKLLADLVAGFVPGEPYSAPWLELFANERVMPRGPIRGTMPDELLAAGRTFVARTDFAPADDFPELRALSWQRGGEVIAGGVHVHDAAPALAAIRARDSKDVAMVVERAEGLGGVARAHGLDVLVVLAGMGPSEPQKPAAPLAWRRDTLGKLAGERRFAMEIVFEPVGDGDLTDVLKKLGTSPEEAGRLLVEFWGYDETEGTPVKRAQALAQGLDGTVTQVASVVLVENVVRKKRIAVEALRQGGSVVALCGEVVQVSARLWRPPPARKQGRREIDPAPLDASVMEPEITAQLRAATGRAPFELTECAPEGWGNRVRVTVKTASPAEVLVALAAYAKAREAMVSLGIQDLDPLARAVRRVIADVGRR